jgi:hypothetical protein
LIIYAKYGCIQVTSTIMTSSSSAMLSAASFLALESAIVCLPGLLVLDVSFYFTDLSMISSQNTPGGTGKHWDPMFSRWLASLLLVLLICDTSHPSNVPSR